MFSSKTPDIYSPELTADIASWLRDWYTSIKHAHNATDSLNP